MQSMQLKKRLKLKSLLTLVKQLMQQQGNVTLTSTTAADGHTIYDVKLNDKVTFGIWC